MDQATITRAKDAIRKRCGHCVAYDDQGTCRRYAPRPIVGLQLETFRVVWPNVKADDWCGEFKPRQL